MSESTRLSIIIVNWNTCDYLASCLTSIARTLPASDTQVIVVDNASADGSVGMVRKRFPDAHLVANATNRGFAGGVNDGLKLADGRYILVLNPDIVLRKGVVDELIAYFQGHSGTGGVMPLLRNADNTVQKGYVRRAPTLMQVFFFATALQPWAGRREGLVSRYLEAPRAGDDAVEVDQIPGAFLLSSREVFTAVGPFDERYRLFFEDVDWCSRAREMGLKLFMLPCLEITHIGGRSFVADEGNRIRARYYASLVTYFAIRKTPFEAAIAGVILTANALFVLIKNIIVRGWGNSQAKKRASHSRRTYWNVLRLFFRRFIMMRDNGPLP